MKITKKRALYGLIIVMSMAAIITGGTLMFRSSDKKDDQAATNTTDKASPNNTSEADAIIRKADAARASRQYDEATALYRQARTHYEQTNDIEKLAEIDAILSLLEVEKKNTPEPAKPIIAGER